MKPRFALLLSAFFLLSTPAIAETHAACCRCGSFYKLSDEGFGFMRHHVGFCPKCTAEMGGSVDAYLDKLRGQNRGLADAAQLTLQQLRAAAAKRDAARDAIYGREGLATGFFSALAGFAAEGASGTFKTVAKYAKQGLDWYNKAADSIEGDFNWVWEEGKGWVKGRTVGAAKNKAVLKSAAAMGRSYYERTGDARGATNQFLSAHADIKKGVSVLESAIKFYEKTDKLANGIQEYLEQRGNAERLGREWDEITDKMEELLAQIAKLEHCRELLQQQNASGSSQSAMDRRPGWTARFAGVPASERAAVKALAFPSDEPDESALRRTHSTLQQLRTHLDAFRANLENEFLPPLLPFWLEVQSDFGAKLNTALLAWATPVADATAREYSRIVRFGEGAADSLRRSTPRSQI